MSPSFQAPKKHGLDFILDFTTEWNDTDWAPVCVFTDCGLCQRHRSVVRSVSVPYCVKATQYCGILCFCVSHISFRVRMTARSFVDNFYLMRFPYQKHVEFRGWHSQNLIGLFISCRPTPCSLSPSSNDVFFNCCPKRFSLAELFAVYTSRRN